MTEETTGTSTTSSPLSDGDSWYFHVRSRDNVGNWANGAKHAGPWKIDTTNPGTPTVSSSTHADENTWYSNNDPQ
jgi:hypothetical protein